jgi:hypothetical protein
VIPALPKSQSTVLFTRAPKAPEAKTKLSFLKKFFIVAPFLTQPYQNIYTVIL